MGSWTTEAGASVQLSQAAPIQFRNREDGGTEARSAFLRGAYYLQLAVVPSDYTAQRLFEIPYTIHLDAVGEADEGPELTGQARPGSSLSPVVWAVLRGLGDGLLLAVAVIGAVTLVRRDR